jgi:diacylglycerol kinase family enzyme
MKVVIVYNPRSGSAIPIRELVRKFKDASIEVVKTIKIEDIATGLRRYHDQNITVVGYGGDGTLNQVAGELLNSKLLFAPLAGGTLNHFTKDLGISQDLDEAIADIKNTTPRRIDVACVNDKVILNNSSIGLYPSSLQMRDEITRKQIGKWPAAVIASGKAFWHYRSYTVTIDGETFKTPFLLVGNNDYRIEQLLIGERKHLNEHILSVYAVVGASRLSLFRIFSKAILRQLESTNEMKIWKAQSLTVHTKRPRIRISRDGEHEKTMTPLEYKIIPDALRIVGGAN